jgi:hypothetical protein
VFDEYANKFALRRDYYLIPLCHHIRHGFGNIVLNRHQAETCCGHALKDDFPGLGNNEAFPLIYFIIIKVIFLGNPEGSCHRLDNRLPLVAVKGKYFTPSQSQFDTFTG